ncbi:MAG: amidohydrolase family protein [Acidimicrobiia bacterium]|jgi:imidazolonepropionase-like amidohydrolase
MASTVFKGGEVFREGGFESADVLVDDGRIVAVGENLSGEETVDCTERVVLPGLFDAHIHMGFPGVDFIDLRKALGEAPEALVLRFPETARKTLALGITTVRDAGGAGYGYKQAIDRGYVVGPRMQTAITMLSMTGGHADDYMAYGGNPRAGHHLPGYIDPLCDGVDQCIRKTREVIRAGAEVVKISASGGFISPNDDPRHPNFLQEEMDAIVRTAADLGVPVMAHAHGAEAIKRAVRAGVRSIEHGTYLDEEGAAMMAENGTWLVSTMTAADANEMLATDESVPAEIRAKFAEIGTPERGAFGTAVEMGVRVAMGTDCPVAPHGTNLRELELMVENGVSAEQALVAATSSAAELMGLENDLGSLETGKLADVVVVSGDPLAFSDLADRIEGVWKDGVRVV